MGSSAPAPNDARNACGDHELCFHNRFDWHSILEHQPPTRVIRIDILHENERLPYRIITSEDGERTEYLVDFPRPIDKTKRRKIHHNHGMMLPFAVSIPHECRLDN